MTLKAKLENAQYSIRFGKSGDESAIHQAHMRSIREVCVREHGPKEILGWGFRDLGERWVKELQNNGKGCFIWVVVCEHSIHGYAFVQKQSDKQAYIAGLYLTPEVLGQGFGKHLMQLMLAAADDWAVDTVCLESSLTAHSFYKAFGFVDTGALEQKVINGYAVSCIPMRYDID